MEATFAITVDPRHGLISVTMSGFFGPADFTAFTNARVKAHGMLKCRPNQHVTLVDIRQMKIQSQDIVEAFTAMLSDATFHAKRLAFVIDKSLARMQIRRAASGRSATFFVDFNAAQEWLLNDERQPRREASMSKAAWLRSITRNTEPNSARNA